MPDFNANADLHRCEMTDREEGKKLTGPRFLETAPVYKCVNRVMDKREADGILYSMTVPLEAGFGKTELQYHDIEAISKRPDFPRL